MPENTGTTRSTNLALIVVMIGVLIAADENRFTDAAGVELGYRWTAIEAVGLYVPGGSAAYPSSVLMNAIPARLAGVPRRVMVMPTPQGEINPLVLAAAKRAGVTEIYRVGGAQAAGHHGDQRGRDADLEAQGAEP